MGKFTVRFLSQGKDIHRENWNRDWQHAYDLASQYDIQEMSKLKHDGEDFILDFDVSLLGESINWESETYPCEKIKQAVAAIISFEPIHRQLRIVKEKIQSCQFEERRYLETFGREALRIIEQATPSEGACLLAGAKKEVNKAMEHSLGKEVKQAVELKRTSRTSQRSIDLAMKEARFYLTRDIDAFIQSATIYHTL